MAVVEHFQESSTSHWGQHFIESSSAINLVKAVMASEDDGEYYDEERFDEEEEDRELEELEGGVISSFIRKKNESGTAKRNETIRELIKCFGSMVRSHTNQSALPDHKGRFHQKDMTYTKLFDASKYVVRAKRYVASFCYMFCFITFVYLIEPMMFLDLLVYT